MDCWVLVRITEAVITSSHNMFKQNKQNNVYPTKPQFYFIKVGFKVSKLYRHVFVITSYVFIHLHSNKIYL